MTTGLLDDPDALTLILQQLRVANNLATSLRELHDFRAVNQYARDHLNAHNADNVHFAEIVHALLGVDMGMLPSDLAAMIRQMSPAYRARLVHLAEQWNTPHAIEDEYFSGCAALALPRLSSELTAIGRSAFAHCTALGVVQWHAPRLTTVGYRAFVDCVSLTLRTWHAPELRHIAPGAFMSCGTLVLLKWNAPRLTTISQNAFINCQNLTLNEWNAVSLTFIGMKAFQNCTSLVLTLDNWFEPKLKYIGREAFQNCTSLVLPDGLPVDVNMHIGVAAFDGCTSLSPLARSQIKAINPHALDPAHAMDPA